jgi:dihydrodipicolinate synthase/N-acetylneuraminate lyase
MEKITTFKNAVKLVALYQATLEQMDTMKGTRLYRQNIKKMMRSLETAIEQTIRGPLSALDETDEEMMSTIQYKVEAILDLSLEELAGLKMAIDEHRSVEHSDVQSKGKN